MKRELKVTDGVNALTDELRDTLKNELRHEHIFGILYADVVHRDMVQSVLMIVYGRPASVVIIF